MDANTKTPAAETLTATKIARMVTGETVVMSDAELTAAEADHEVRSIVNPNRVGVLDLWLCWIEA